MLGEMRTQWEIRLRGVSDSYKATTTTTRTCARVRRPMERGDARGGGGTFFLSHATDGPMMDDDGGALATRPPQSAGACALMGAGCCCVRTMAHACDFRLVQRVRACSAVERTICLASAFVLKKRLT